MTGMADVLEIKRSGNAQIGERVHTLMWREGRTQKQLGQLLGVDQGSISNRLRGKTNWSAIEVSIVAAWLSVSITDLVDAVELPGPDGPDTPSSGADLVSERSSVQS